MFVCVCHAITDRDIHDAVDAAGVEHVDQLEALCGAGSSCGTCRHSAQELIESRLTEGQAYAAA